MRLTLLSFLPILVLLAGEALGDSPKGDSSPIYVTINSTKVGPPISPFIYGQFIEHLGRCIYGGIWAEMLEDRKFYYPITDEYHPYGELVKTDFPVITASPWQVVGPKGSVTMEKEHALAGEHSVKIAKGSGIQQNDLGLVGGQQYEGYARVCVPEGRSGLNVSLLSEDGKASDSVTKYLDSLGASDGYVVQRFRFQPRTSTDHGRLLIKVDGSPCVIGAVSLMPANNVRGFRFDTLMLLKQLNAPIYRWPGGNFVSGYDWRDGIGPRDRRPPRKNPAWTGIDSNDVGIDEFLDLCHEIKAEPMVAVNTGFGDDYSAAQEVEYANGAKETIGGQWRAENGHVEPYCVKYWCVGNEMFGPWQLGHMELGQYVLKHKRFTAAMRKVDPKIILVGSGDLGTKSSLAEKHATHNVSWTEGMLERCGNEMDYISEHFYKGNTPWREQPSTELPTYVALLKDEIRSKAKSHRELQAKLGRTSDRYMPIAMDEWNYWHRGYVYGELGCEYSLADALGVAAGLHEYFRNSDIIHMANYAQTVNVIGCIKTTKTTAFFDTTALPLLLYRREFGSEPLEVTGNNGQHGIDVAAAKTKDGREITIGVVNPQSMSQEIAIKFNGVRRGPAANVWRITAADSAARNTAEKKQVVITKEKNISIGEQITVPPYSISLYRVPIE